MRDYLRTHEGEVRLFVVLAALTLYLGFASPTFLSAGNFASLLNNNAVNVIWAVGLLVVLITGGIDISFAVAASVVQYLTALALHRPRRRQLDPRPPVRGRFRNRASVASTPP